VRGRSSAGGGRLPISIDVAAAEGRYERALAHSETPERLYDRQWCLTLLAGVLEGLREDYEAAGKARVFDRLKDFLTADEGGTHAEAARELGMTEPAVKVAVHRLRRRYRDELRRRVAETVESAEDVEDEIRHLLKTLGRSKDGR
jgi:DNA-directed RNA polymerase specialized sigma24 family protein